MNSIYALSQGSKDGRIMPHGFEFSSYEEFLALSKNYDAAEEDYAFHFVLNEAPLPKRTLTDYFNFVKSISYVIDMAAQGFAVSVVHKVTDERGEINFYEDFLKCEMNPDDYAISDEFGKPVDFVDDIKGFMGVFEKIESLSVKNLAALKFIMVHQCTFDLDVALGMLFLITVSDETLEEWSTEQWELLFLKGDGWLPASTLLDFVDLEVFGKFAVNSGMITEVTVGGDSYLITNS